MLHVKLPLLPLQALKEVGAAAAVDSLAMNKVRDGL
jgi:hypothetical protein